MSIKTNDVLDDAFLHDVESIDWSEIIKADGTKWKNAPPLEEMADVVTEQVDETRANSISDLNDFYSEFDPGPHRFDDDDLIGVSEILKAVGAERTGRDHLAIHDFYFDTLTSAVKDSLLKTEINVSEMEFCRRASLGQIRGLLKQRDEFGQAALLVLLEHFRPDFFAIDQQMITQNVVDLKLANELIEALNARLMFCSDQYYHVGDHGERAIVKHYLLKIVRSANGAVNLRGQYHGGWINVTGVATSPKGEILKIMVQVDPFRAPPAMFRYYNP